MGSQGQGARQQGSRPPWAEVWRSSMRTRLERFAPALGLGPFVLLRVLGVVVRSSMTMAANDPTERVLRARLAAHALHAKLDDPAAHTAPARRSFLERFEREVDPEGILEPVERARRAEH